MDIPRTREEAQEDLQSITDQISEGIEKGRYSLSQLQTALMDKTKQAATQTDELVRDNPWSAIGIGVAVGVLLGLLLPRK